MSVCQQDLLVRLTCRPQKTKNSVHCAPAGHTASMQANPRSAWGQPIDRVSRNVSRTVLCGCRVLRNYLAIIISAGCDNMGWSAAPAKKDYRLVDCESRL